MFRRSSKPICFTGDLVEQEYSSECNDMWEELGFEVPSTVNQALDNILALLYQVFENEDAEGEE